MGTARFLGPTLCLLIYDLRRWYLGFLFFKYFSEIFMQPCLQITGAKPNTKKNSWASTLFIHSEIFIECLLCVSPCSSLWKFSSEQNNNCDLTKPQFYKEGKKSNKRIYCKMFSKLDVHFNFLIQ